MHLIWIQHLNILAFSLLIFVGSFSNEEKQAPMILYTVYTCLLNPHICHRSPYYSYCLFGQLPPCSHIFPILPLAWPLGMPHLCGFLSFSMLLLRHTIASIPPPYTNPILLLSQPCVHCCFCTGKRKELSPIWYTHNLSPKQRYVRGVASVINEMELSFLFQFSMSST